jgi:hypothetical protein
VTIGLSFFPENIHNGMIKYLSPTSHWVRFCILLILFSVFKAALYFSLIPPFEGWDEYQHLSYIYHLEETGSRPVLQNANVSRELLKGATRFPQPDSMLNQTPGVGAVSYKQFYSSSDHPQYNPNHDDIPLYQAQHGPLYYKLSSHLINRGFIHNRPENQINLLRLLNVVFTIVSLSICMLVVKQIYKQNNRAAVVCCLIFCQPLFLLNGIRLASDSFAILCGTLVVLLSVVPRYRQSIFGNILAGVMIGLATVVKSTGIVLLPFWLLTLAISTFRKELALRRFTAFAGITVLLFSAIMYKSLIFNLFHYQVAFVMQEALVNQKNDVRFIDLLSSGLQFSIAWDIITLWFKKTTWTGGWSMLQVSNISNITFTLYSIGFAGWISWVVLGKFKESKQGSHNQIFIAFFAFVILTSIALGWHHIQSITAWGVSTTCAWYAAIALPCFLILFYEGASHWSQRIGFLLTIALIFVYGYADIIGILTMIYHYSGGETGYEAVSRIVELNHLYMSEIIFMTILVAFISMYVLLISTIILSERENTSLVVRESL